MWGEISALIVGILGSGTFVAWLVRRAVDHGLELTLVKLRADLDRESMLLRIRYEPLFGRQAETLIDLYPKLDELLFRGVNLVASGTLRSDPEYTEFMELSRECYMSVRSARIYLPNDLDCLLDETLTSLHRFVSKGHAANYRLDRGPAGPGRERAIHDIDSAERELNNLLNRLRSEVRQYIQELLGVDLAKRDFASRSRGTSD